jgi:hypothetical protein
MKPFSRKNLQMRSLCRRGAAVLALMIALALAGQHPVFAERDGEQRVISDEWHLQIGGALTDFKTTAAAGSSGALGVVIRFEDQLKLEEDKSFARGDGFYRFNERHGIGFGFWSLKRSGLNVLQDEIDWEGVTYPVGALIDTEFDASWIRADWRYSFMRMDRGEAGFALGFSYYDVSGKISGIGAIGGGPQGSFTGEGGYGVPVPTFGLFINFGITETVLFNTYFNWLKFDVGDISGGVTDISLAIEWYITDHFGIGGGTTRTEISYENSGTNPLTIDYTQSGFMAYLTFVFGDID